VQPRRDAREQAEQRDRVRALDRHQCHAPQRHARRAERGQQLTSTPSAAAAGADTDARGAHGAPRDERAHKRGPRVRAPEHAQAR
jgi:hypothetical protein